MGAPIASTTGQSRDRVSLAERLAQIARSIGDKDPDKRAQGYSYFSAKAVYGWWEQPLHEAGILFYPAEILSERTESYTQSTRSGGRTTWLTSLAVRFEFTDGVETISVVGYGQGEDPADKGAGKAMTYAQKNALLGAGMNGNEPDVEEESRYDARDRRQEELDRDRDDRRSRDRDRDDDRDDRRSSRDDRDDRGSRDRGRDRDRDRDDRDRDREDDRGRDRDRDRDRGDRGSRRVEFGDGEVEGIQRGGRANRTTDVQLRKIRELAREAGMTPHEVADEIDRTLGDQVDLPEKGTDDAGPALVKYLEGLSSEDAGKLIDALDRAGRGR